jgi:hypothetical protein
MAVGPTRSMFDEQPPNDGHRMNIMSSGPLKSGSPSRTTEQAPSG